MKPEYRKKKLEEQIRNLIFEALRRLKEPEVENFKDFVVVSRVELSKDKRYADIFISYIGNSEMREKAVKFMKDRKGYFRTFVAKNTRLYVAPEIRFYEDKGIETSIRINKLLDEISSKKHEKESDN
ncbi:30S ribosome-binding factor RbfA [Thermosipho ferrireducens]|uniref:Ribosome-binding factor A n=1 Tax=Thermosipho ferrireducens TaxID=2571116 RepID=A0ABX7S5K3_9BACT|nr:30S ribosome-binding factor RbfA [Thermosipho ferrireducens]QTA37828.1 30S ribosome-binding factor RbfA [Thermosipho ferrireducens]